MASMPADDETTSDGSQDADSMILDDWDNWMGLIES